jgi:transposase
MVAYSEDLRQRVLAAVDAAEGTQEEIAKRFRVSSPGIRKMLVLRDRTGSIAPKPRSGGRKPLIQADRADALKDAIRNAPDAPLQQRREVTGFKGCLMTVWRTRRRLNVTRKKSRYRRRSNSTRKSSPRGVSGARGWGRSTRGGSSSSTKAMPRRP